MSLNYEPALVTIKSCEYLKTVHSFFIVWYKMLLTAGFAGTHPAMELVSPINLIQTFFRGIRVM